MNAAVLRLTVALAALALSVGACTGGSEKTWPARHVVVISMDTTRADHFGFMGNELVKTPNLDALAKESVVFTDYMTVVPTTLASHTSLFTGKYPHNHGTPRNGFMVHRANEMLAEILKREGFHTAGFIGSFALDSRFDFAQGFDHYDETFDVFVGDGDADQNQRSAADVTDAVARYLDKLGVPERAFLFVHYFDPHRPYAAPPPFDKAYDPQGRADLPTLRQIEDSTPDVLARASRFARRHAAQYASEISYMDHHIGRLLEDLDARGILDDAVVVVTSDHGENFWEHHSTFDHGYTLYQTTTRAVCMMRLPDGRLGGTPVEQLVASIDVLPTLLGFLDLPVPSDIDGRAFPLANPEAPFPPLARYGQATKPGPRVETDPRWPNMRKSRSVRDGRFKFIETPYEATRELYDVVADPTEQSNLLDDPTPEVNALAERLRPKLRAWAASARPLPLRFEQQQADETAERLRSLGYLQ